MQIRDIRATPVTVPLQAPLRHANGCHWGRFVRTIVEVETDDGLVGLGEMGGDGEAATAAFESLKPSLLGRDPGRLEEMRFLLANPTALLYNNRTQIVAALFSVHKLKGGVFPPEYELECYRALARAFPEDRLRFDPLQLATMLHLGAVLPNLAFAADAHYHHLTDDVIEGGRLPYDGGALTVPTGPGLGVRLDREKLERYHEEFRRLGSYPYDQDPLRPGWTPLVPNDRWADPADDTAPEIPV